MDSEGLHDAMTRKVDKQIENTLTMLSEHDYTVSEALALVFSRLNLFAETAGFAIVKETV